MNDSFANFLCQKLILLAKDHQIDQILEAIKKDFDKIATNKHGTRALQCLLDEI